MKIIENLKKLPNQKQTAENAPQGIQPAAGPPATTTVNVSGQTYSRFNTSEDVVNQQKELVTAGLWSGGTGTLTTFFTSSVQTVSQKRHYIDVLNAAPDVETRATQFALAFGHAEGSGSSKLGTLESPSSQAVYSQYKQLLLNKTSNSCSTVFLNNFSKYADAINVLAPYLWTTSVVNSTYAKVVPMDNSVTPCYKQLLSTYPELSIGASGGIGEC